MATQALARGPLSTALGQWMFLGFGTFVIFTGDNGVSRAAQEVASIALSLVAGRDGRALLREAALGSAATRAAQGSAGSNQPIIIHHSSSGNDGGLGGWTAAVVRLGIGAGACWTAYVVFANFLPDNVKEMLPVTRRFFESAVTSLGQGIIRVRDCLSEQIALLGVKQDELSEKQSETHSHVLGLRDDVDRVRSHIDNVARAISRCEGSLADAAGRQTYMSRGVRLLVQCVGDLLRPSNPSVADELDQFSRLSAELMDDGGYRPGEGGGRLQCPASPNLSEIGSMASTLPGEEHQQVRPPSLPRPGGADSGAAPNFMGMSTPRLKMLQSFSGRAGGGAATTAVASTNTPPANAPGGVRRSDSSPENEVPRSNSPGTEEPVRLEELDVDDILAFVRSGGDRNSLVRI